MGRTSKLTESQWDIIGRRLVAGETTRSLGAEFGIAESAIRKRFGAQTKQVKDVANQLAAAETAFSALPISAQISARTLADSLKSISENLAAAASNGAMTAQHLSAIANRQAATIKNASTLEQAEIETLKGVAILTKMANDSSQIGINLLQSNKEQIAQMNNQAREEASKKDKPATRPQLTKQEWLQAHGLGTATRAAE